jgi:hypothetical protein
MSLFSITYTSVRVGPFIVKDFVDLAERSAAYNAVSEVTGFLCHADGQFLQTLEGEHQEVNRIYHTRIVPARSHNDLRLIHLEHPTERRFLRWSMGFANVAPSDQALLRRFIPTGLTQAELIVGIEALNFLQALSASEDTLTIA